MKRTLQNCICLLLAGLTVCLSGCGALSLTEEERQEIQEDAAEVVVGQSIGQELAQTYAADHIFSLNSVSTASFNPYLTSSEWNKVVGMLVYETLVTHDTAFEAQPNLITSWETEDGVNWTFYVDTTRKFHNGDDFTAMDAVYTLQYAMGMHNVYSTKYQARFRNVDSVVYQDRDRFSVKLKKANYRFYELMNIPCIEYNTGFSSVPPGTGPYEFSTSGSYLTLFSGHPHAKKMPIETIHLKEYSAAVDILQAFEDSYLDLVVNDPTGMANLGYSSTNIIKYIDTTSMHYLGYNMYSSIFSQNVYRSIMTYAIDRAGITSGVMQGAATPAALPIHPANALYPKKIADTMAYTTDGFKTALKNVGAVDVDGDGYLELGGMRYTINFLVCSDSSVKVSAARQIAKTMRDAGLDVNLREMDYEAYLQELEDGNFDIYYAEVRLCNDWDLEPLLGMDKDLNYGNVRDGSLEGYIQSVLSSPEELQQANAEQLYQYIAQTAPITTICFEKSEMLYHRGVLFGLEPIQDNLFNNMQNWTVDLS